jgi:hypothetical protein
VATRDQVLGHVKKAGKKERKKGEDEHIGKICLGRLLRRVPGTKIDLTAKL